MFPGSILTDLCGMPNARRGEQRLHRRYPIVLDLHYKLWDQAPSTDTRSGKTLNISSGGILFEAREPVPKQGPIELAIDWPFLLNSACHLKLIVRGRIVRSDRMGTAVAILRHDFRTSKRAIA
jgi:hypothetical protein